MEPVLPSISTLLSFPGFFILKKLEDGGGGGGGGVGVGLLYQKGDYSV